MVRVRYKSGPHHRTQGTEGGPHSDGSRFVKITYLKVCDDYTEAQVRQFSSCGNVVTGEVSNGYR